MPTDPACPLILHSYIIGRVPVGGQPVPSCLGSRCAMWSPVPTGSPAQPTGRCGLTTAGQVFADPAAPAKG